MHVSSTLAESAAQTEINTAARRGCSAQVQLLFPIYLFIIGRTKRTAREINSELPVMRIYILLLGWRKNVERAQSRE